MEQVRDYIAMSRIIPSADCLVTTRRTRFWNATSHGRSRC